MNCRYSWREGIAWARGYSDGLASKPSDPSVAVGGCTAAYERGHAVGVRIGSKVADPVGA